jgi:hypothetical protein
MALDSCAALFHRRSQSAQLLVCQTCADHQRTPQYDQSSTP